MQQDTLQAATDGRLLVFARMEYVECSAFMVIVAHNGREIVEEIIFPYELGAFFFMRKIQELAELYSLYAGLIELQTDHTELIRLAANTAGIHITPKRKKDIEPFTKRALEQFTRDGVIYDLYDIEPIEEQERSKLREWLINVLQKTLNKLEGKRK